MKRSLARAAGLLLVATGIPVLGLQAPSQAADAVRPTDGLTQETAAGSCWEVKQKDPNATDGVYWLITPELGAPDQFYCDQTTDGGGWVLIGRGRQGWKNWYYGTGTPAQVRNTPAGTGAFAPAQLPSTTVDDLLNGGRVNALADGVRLRRAADVAGATWTETRFQLPKRTRWAWTFGAENPVGAYRFGTATGSGGTTANFGRDNSFQRVNFAEASNQGFLAGFAFGGSVPGFNNATSYLWSATDNLGGARPFTQMYLRPQLSRDTMFNQTVPDEGTAAQEQRALPESDAQRTVWGVSGLANGTGELNTEVQAFGQVGDRVFVGGNFATPQRDANGTGALNQPYLAAFDVNTGELATNFRPTLNNQVKSLVAMPDGRLAVGGTFTQVNGQAQAGLAFLDPATGALAGAQVNVENRSTGGAPSVRGLEIGGGHLYLSGSFTHMTQGTVSAATWNSGRVVLSNSRPDTNWNPTINGTSVGLDYSSQGDRVYYSGYFQTVKNQSQPRVTAISPAAGAAQALPGWTASLNRAATANSWQFGVQEIGSRLYHGGSEHMLYGYDRTTLQRQSGSITKNGGDFQTVTADASYDAIIAGCHCGDFTFQDAYNWSALDPTWTQADSIGTFGAWDASTGNYLPEFNPVVKGREGYGAWATFVDSRGVLWVGGDYRTSLRAGAVNQWSGGYMRFAPRDTQAPTRPTNVQSTGSTASEVRLSWNASSDNNAGVTYEVMENNRVVATTSARSLTLSRPEGDLRYFVRARDAAGNRSASTQVLNLGEVGQPPAPPAAPTVTATTLSQTGIRLSWPDQTAGGGYTVARDGATVATLPAGSTQYDDTGLTAGTEYTYVVTARDTVGQSTPSAPVSATTSAAPQQRTLVAEGASWRWRYEDSAPAANWAEPDFDDSSWASGAAPLGFGHASIATDISAGLVTRKPLSAQFRTSFELEDLNSTGTVQLTVVGDDGAVVYVNGTEVARRNLGTGTVSWNSYATAAPRTATANTNALVVEVPRSVLRDGRNVVSGQTNLNYRATPDVSFKLVLEDRG